MTLWDLGYKVYNAYKSNQSFKRHGNRGYGAAQNNRFVQGWLNTANKIDRAVKEGMIALRGRSRDLTQNNPYARAAIMRNRTNVTGPEGFTFKWRSKNSDGTLNKPANEIIEAGFKQWSKKQNCTMRGMFPFVVVQHLIDQQMERDGEFIVRIIKGRSAGNKFGFSLDMLEVDDIDERYNAELSNGNIVKMGIELNKWRKPVAYWIRKAPLSSELSYIDNYGTDHERVPAENIIYGFDPEHPKQTRAVSPMAAAMMSLHMIDGWEQASIINARANAQTMGFLERKRADIDSLADIYKVNEDDEVISEFKDGQIEELPFGYEFKDWQRQYPHAQHAPFLKSMLRKVATALGVSYNGLANDLEGVNFSSMRSGLNEEREQWKLKQMLRRELFLMDVAEQWLEMALLSGALRPLSAADYEQYNVPVITGRKWPYIDPTKDAAANKIATEMGWKSRKDIIEEMGGNKDEVDAEIEEDSEFSAKHGLGNYDEIIITDPNEEEENKPEDDNKSHLKIYSS